MLIMQTPMLSELFSMAVTQTRFGVVSVLGGRALTLYIKSMAATGCVFACASKQNSRFAR